MEIIEEKTIQLLPDGNDLLEYFAQQNYKRGIEQGIKQVMVRRIEEAKFKIAEKSILQD